MLLLLLLLLLQSLFSRVRLCGTPQMAAHQAPPSLGFSRQEHWSGLPFPSPVHKCIYMCVCVCVLSVAWSYPTLSDPMDCRHQAPLFIEFSRQEYWRRLPYPPPEDYPYPGIKPVSPALAGDSLPLCHLGSSQECILVKYII